jgi:hypothetical protein
MATYTTQPYSPWLNFAGSTLPPRNSGINPGGNFYGPGGQKEQMLYTRPEQGGGGVVARREYPPVGSPQSGGYYPGGGYGMNPWRAFTGGYPSGMGGYGNASQYQYGGLSPWYGGAGVTTPSLMSRFPYRQAYGAFPWRRPDAPGVEVPQTSHGSDSGFSTPDTGPVSGGTGFPGFPGSGGFPKFPGSGGFPGFPGSGGFPRFPSSGGFPGSGSGFPTFPGFPGSGGFPSAPWRVF